jgi:hypothetical protein
MQSNEPGDYQDFPIDDAAIRNWHSNDPHVGELVDSSQDAEHAVFGNPIGDKSFWHPQTGDYTCAVEAQAGILECLTGEKVTELDAAVESAQLGLLTTEGTLPHHIGAWLEQHNVECHANENGTFLDVIRELRDGNKVIVGVNAHSLWDTNDSLNAFAHQVKDHAIWLTGVDASDPHHVKVTINDSGKPDGAGNVYDLHELDGVLNCPGFHYVATGHGPSYLPDDPPGYDAHDGIFHGLDQFLHDHAMPIVGVAAVAAFAAANLVRNPSEAKPSQNPGIPALPKPTRYLELPSSHSKPEELSREERDQVLRNL